MINVQFFPSKRIAFYMAKTFLLRSLAVLAALVIILQTLDLLGESGKILRHPGNSDADLWYYVSLRLPQLVQRFLPFSALLGALITLATMNQNSEIVSMKAAGISAHQIIAPLVLASLLLAAAAFIFQEQVVTRATAELNAWQAVDYGEVPPGTGISSSVWVRRGNDLIHARQVSGRGPATRLDQVSIYSREGETLTGVTTAARAEPAGDAWRLVDIERFDVEGGRVGHVDELVSMEGVEPDQFALSGIRADEQDVAALGDAIRDLKQAGLPTMALESGFWHKFSGPLSTVLMPLLAAIAAFGLARTGQLFLRVVAGMALGFAYFVIDNFALAMGNLGAYPPLLAAWAPFVLFLLVGETVLVRTEE